MENQQGTITLHSRIMDHWIWDDPVRLKAWLTILMEVSPKSTKKVVNNTVVECGCGQSTHAVHIWAERLGDGWTVSKVRNFFKLLEGDGMIYREKISNTTRLTVCNYVAYQKGEQKVDISSTIGEQEVDKISTTGKQVLDKRSTADEHVVSTRSTIDEQKVDIRSTTGEQEIDIRLATGEQMVDMRSIIGEQEVNNSLTNVDCENSNDLKTSGKESGGVKKPDNNIYNIKSVDIGNNKKNKKDIYMKDISSENFPDDDKLVAQITERFYETILFNLESMEVSIARLQKAKITNWMDPIRLILKQKESTPEQLNQLAEYLREDLFWRKVILSTSKMREKLPHLIIAMKSAEESARSGPKHLLPSDNRHYAYGKHDEAERL